MMIRPVAIAAFLRLMMCGTTRPVGIVVRMPAAGVSQVKERPLVRGDEQPPRIE